MKLFKFKPHLPLVLFCFVLSACSESRYEQKMQHSETVTDPWARFSGLSADVDPNAWARTWQNETDDQAKWAAATYLALQEAIRKRDPRAFDYVGKGKYSEYASLQELRAELPAQADVLERLKTECDKAGVVLSREYLASLSRGAAQMKLSTCSDKVQADHEAARREHVLAKAESGSTK